MGCGLGGGWRVLPPPLVPVAPRNKELRKLGEVVSRLLARIYRLIVRGFGSRQMRYDTS